MPIERKLAAIMFTDIAGYTALSAKDENKALELLDKQEQILTPIIEEFNGTLHNKVGDGLLFTFPTVTDAVKCGIKIQEETKAVDDLNLRIGIHEGEITMKDGDALGDDVNVASRIEAFSSSGGIAISSKVQQNISSLPEFETSYVGKPELKGVAQEVKVYCITSHGLQKAEEIAEPVILESKSNFNIFALTGGILTAIGIAFWIAVGVFDFSFGGKAEVPSVGILMMENRGDEEDEFWASSITEDLIIKVAGAGLIRVVPMKEILEVNIKESFEGIAKKLRVKYLLTSSLHKKEDGFDLRCQLIEAESGNTKYANKWSEPIDNAPTIVSNLADNILKTLNISTKQNIPKVPTSNAEAYEYYLKSKYYYNTYIKLADIQSLDIARGLLEKAIELDNNLLSPKILLGRTYYFEKVDNEEHYNKMLTIARGLFEKALKKAEELDDKYWIGRSLRNIGNTYFSFEDEDKAYNYYIRSLKINEEIGDLDGMAHSLNNIGTWFRNKGDLDKALNYLIRTLDIREELGDEASILHTHSNLGHTYRIKGNYDKALESYTIALKISEEIGDKVGMGWAINSIGIIYLDKGNYKKATEYLEKSVKINNEIRGGYYLSLWSTVHLNLSYKNLGKTYFKQDIIQLIKGAQDIEYLINFPLYQLLEDTSYLETAYNQVQERASEIDENLARKFLSYPIPSAIVEEWEKVTTDKN